jgi:hypothetical protein
VNTKDYPRQTFDGSRAKGRGSTLASQASQAVASRKLLARANVDVGTAALGCRRARLCIQSRPGYHSSRPRDSRPNLTVKSNTTGDS